MTLTRRLASLVLACAAVAATAPSIHGDEGMWTFDNPPTRLLQERYHFTPAAVWLDHLRLASVRFNDGGSGSFVSPTGLVLTNHHVARGQLQKISTPQKDYVADGFYARSPAEELKVPDLELNVLISMENVTPQVQAAEAGAAGGEAVLKARRAAIAKIEKASLDRTGLRSDVVTLYGGSEYWLYRYKRYTDVRLVFAPEGQVAFFGGDPDNFTYPRYDLDMAIFRVYDEGKPVDSTNYLKWNVSGANAGDLVFVSGNPGATARLDTVAQLETLRDSVLPAVLTALRGGVSTLERFGARGAEQTREGGDLKFDLQNSIKAIDGELAGLRTPAIMAKKEAEQHAFRAAVGKDPKLDQEYGGAWTAIEGAERAARERMMPYLYRSPRLSFARSATLALQLVRYVEESTKPDAQRLPGYHEAQLPSLRVQLFSPAPLYPEMDQALLANWLQEALGVLGADDPFLKAVLAGQTPADRARSLMAGSKLGDPAFRKQLADGGVAAVNASADPLIGFARTVDPFMREMQTWHETAVESVESVATANLARARFAIYGKTTYPDATFTLRLSYGTVRGYLMNGTEAPPRTTFYGLFDRALGFGNTPPFDLPRRLADRRQALDLGTPLNFVSDADIIGGNSGSPVVDRDGNLVGLIFDGNIESLVGLYVYSPEANRAVAVHAAAIVQALRRVYDAGALADELTGSRR